MAVNYWAILPAAGLGQRFGGYIPKQYATLQGKTVIEHALNQFLMHPQIQKIVVVIARDDSYWSQFGLHQSSDQLLVVTGGPTRCGSVLAGLNALSVIAQPNDFVLVHDAARPCLHREDIDKLIKTGANHPVGAILGAKIRDTLKYANQRNEIVSTISRENVWQALTPQMFRCRLLTQALEEAIATRQEVTDEASAIELLGFVPLMVEGRSSNIKITYPEDLLLAEKCLS